MDEDELGYYRKYLVRRADGDPGYKHQFCEYFVLDLVHDRFAFPALEAYITACVAEYPELAHDLRLRIDRGQPAAGGA